VDTRPASIEPTRPASKRRIGERFDETLQRGFEWVIDNSQTVIAVLVGTLLIGGIAAGIYEWIESSRNAAFDELARVERALEKALPRDASGLPVIDTANPEIAKKAREEALAGFDRVAAEHSGSLAGTAAALHAARIEITLGRLDAADQRLAALIPTLDGDVERATALRLHGYVLEETNRGEQAADLYARVGAIEAYPGRIQSYVQAAETYERIGKVPQAIAALEALTAIAPEYAEQADILSQLETLRARQVREGTPSKPAE
jgi:tetratricopeptide (TPR) repeat protein